MPRYPRAPIVPIWPRALGSGLSGLWVPGSGPGFRALWALGSLAPGSGFSGPGLWAGLSRLSDLGPAKVIHNLRAVVSRSKS